MGWGILSGSDLKGQKVVPPFRIMPGISIIIPCRNEEKYISRCIDSLLRQDDAIFDREIIVVDNGSTDNTQNILKGYGSTIACYVRPDLPIAGLRNFGFEKSTKEWIAFVDADVEVDGNWAKAFSEFLEELRKKGIDEKKVISGSTCLVPLNPTWVEQVWYEQLMERDSESTKYINCGNLVLHREMMSRLGGFDPSYKTGEEEKLCEDARLLHEGLVLKNERMKAIHHGYPKNIPSFFQRMRWHGKGMSRYFFRPWKSKPLLLAIFYMLITIVYVYFLLTSEKYFLWTMVYIFLQITPALILSLKRCRGTIKNILLLAFLYACFGWARVMSIFDSLLRKEIYQNK